jgi:hypothetical protein
MGHSKQYTEEQKRHFQQEFQKRKKRRLTVFFIVIGLMIGALFTYPNFVLFGMPKTVWGPVFTLVILGLLLVIIIDWRCPVCNGLMGDVFQTKFCPRCGYKFRD